MSFDIEKGRGNKADQERDQANQSARRRGLYLNPSDFIREAVREKLQSIKVIEYRDVDYETAKKEVAGYFHMKGEAYASDAGTDLQLDYDLVCKIMDDLEKEGLLGRLAWWDMRLATPSTVIELQQRPEKSLVQ